MRSKLIFIAALLWSVFYKKTRSEKILKRYIKNSYKQAHGKKAKETKLGDLLEVIIRIITLGQGKRIAKFISRLFGFKNCGCDERQDRLNKYKFTKDGIERL